jgi:hypothetical protein
MIRVAVWLGPAAIGVPAMVTRVCLGWVPQSIEEANLDRRPHYLRSLRRECILIFGRMNVLHEGDLLFGTDRLA